MCVKIISHNARYGRIKTSSINRFIDIFELLILATNKLRSIATTIKTILSQVIVSTKLFWKRRLKERTVKEICWLVVWVYGISNSLGYLILNQFIHFILK